MISMEGSKINHYCYISYFHYYYLFIIIIIIIVIFLGILSHVSEAIFFRWIDYK